MALSTDLPAGPAEVYVLRALGLGDLLTGVPALRGLRRHLPQARIVLATPAPLRDLALLTGAVDAVAPAAGLGDLDHRPHRSPDVAVNLHGRGPQSLDHLCAVTPGRVLSHRHPAHPEVDGPDWDADVHEVDRWCRLLGWYGIDCDADDLLLARPEGGPDGRGLVVVHPGAAAVSRRWPVERFAAVAAALHADGHDVVLTGNRAEADLAHEVARRAGLPAAAVLAGTLDVLGLVALIHDCRLVVCGDTGVGHVATATGTPSVLLFGPTSPAHWGPRRPGRHVALWAGRTGDPHAGDPDPGLLALTTTTVLDAVDETLRECS